MAESVFLADPDCPTLVVNKQSNKTTKVLSQRARGSRETLFFFSFYLFIYFIYFISSIQFRILTFLKDARTRRLPESTARSSRARSHGLTLSVRLCDPYVLARPRTTSTDAPRSPKCSRQVSKKIRNSKQKIRKTRETERIEKTSAKRSKKSNNSRKMKEKPCGPWPSLPSAVFFIKRPGGP